MTTESPDPQPSRGTPPPPSDGRKTHALFAGVDELCERAARCALADGAALAVVTRDAHTRELAYATDTIAVRLDELQFTLGEGPCLDAYLDDEPHFHPNLDSVNQTSRWPTFATEATQLGVHSLFAFPVPGARQPSGPSGVLELYRRTASSLTEKQHAVAQAGAAAIGHRLQTNWEEHLARFGSTKEAIDAAATASAEPDGTAEPFTRTQIHVAAGMLAIQLNAHPDDALDRLRAHSYACGRRISSVAADIIAHRLTLHDEPDPPHQ
jgi:hypothetical protein